MFFSIQSGSRSQMIDITPKIQETIDAVGITDGMVMVFSPHTTAAVTINENADPSVPVDIETILDRMIPWKADYRHMEGNSAAHAKSSLVGASELVAIENGQLILGTWQSVFFCEFDGPRKRKVQLSFFP
ncbi:MAG: YjbQ family protein [Deltaproteobacteria bacterium]|nr:YjbQ family protein [Deltaproteobacteria bacterium]MBW2218529.1 YjbQ family protein [Deltaproteobacteria bacterium]